MIKECFHYGYSNDVAAALRGGGGALLIAALTRTKFTVQRISLVGVMAALSFVAYEFFRIPFAGGSSFHLGNTFTALTAMLLDGVSGGLAL